MRPDTRGSRARARRRGRARPARSRAASAAPRRGRPLAHRESPGVASALNTAGLDRAVGVQRLGDVRQEDDRIVVAVVERDPGELATRRWPPTAPSAVVLPYPGGATMLTKRPLRARREAVDELVPLDQAGRGGGMSSLDARARTPAALPSGLWRSRPLTVDALRHRTCSSGIRSIHPTNTVRKRALQANVSIRLTSKLRARRHARLWLRTSALRRARGPGRRPRGASSAAWRRNASGGSADVLRRSSEACPSGSGRRSAARRSRRACAARSGVEMPGADLRPPAGDGQRARRRASPASADIPSKRSVSPAK